MTTTRASNNPSMPADAEPGRNCPLCPRLVEFRAAWRDKEPDWFNAPVPSFGPPDARLLIVGLAPGLQGANRTGRPFTGDYAGVLLYETLAAFGFSRGKFDARPDDGRLHTQPGRKLSYTSRRLLRRMEDGSAQAPMKVGPSTDMPRVGAWSL